MYVFKFKERVFFWNILILVWICCLFPKFKSRLPLEIKNFDFPFLDSCLKSRKLEKIFLILDCWNSWTFKNSWFLLESRFKSSWFLILVPTSKNSSCSSLLYAKIFWQFLWFLAAIAALQVAMSVSLFVCLQRVL